MRSLAFALILGVLVPMTAARAEMAPSATTVRPLLVGSPAADAPLRTLDGTDTTLRAVLAGKPTLLVFYRGGWCPFCNLQLAEMRHLAPDLEQHGVQLVAVSPDRPEVLSQTLDQGDIDFQLLSDSKAELMQAYGIAFTVDADTRTRLGEYGIDLAQASGEAHHALPVPSVFLIDAAGTVQFSYVNPDYRTRVPLRIVRAAIEAVALGEAGRPLR
jgi:peroxiredoxin